MHKKKTKYHNMISHENNKLTSFYMQQTVVANDLEFVCMFSAENEDDMLINRSRNLNYWENIRFQVTG